MLNLQRDITNVNAELRNNPRIELHNPVAIIGIDSGARIIDFSVNGFYIETESVTELEIDQKVNLGLKLPGENASITVKVKIVHRDKKGFGCKICNLTPEAKDVMERCFSVFSATLPIE